MNLIVRLTLTLCTTLTFAQQPEVGKAMHKGKTKAKTTSAELAKRMTTWFPEFNHTPNLVYKTVGDQKLQLDLLTPKGLQSEAAPLLLYIHGGGWGGGDRYRCARPDISGVFKRCAAAGILCATLEYRLNSSKATAFDSATDCKDALRFLVKHAKTHRIDPERIGAIGGSAGGHLSLVTALGHPQDYPGDPTLMGYDPKSLRCEVAYYPATDFTDVKLAERFIGPQRATLMFGGPADQKADIIRLLSPVQLIKKDSTPVYCFHGDEDTVLSVENSRRLFAKGRQIGADIRYTEVQDGNHGFSSNGSPSLDEIITKASDFIITQLTK